MKLVLLDKDGVINHDSPAYIKSVAELSFIPGSLEAIARLSQAGWRVVLCTNQAGLEKAKYSYEAFAEMCAHLHACLAELGGRIEAIAFAPSGDPANELRKPNPGMLKDVARRLGVPLHGVWMIGDSAKDLEAAHAAGATPVLVRTGNGTDYAATAESKGIAMYADLAAVAKALLEC